MAVDGEIAGKGKEPLTSPPAPRATLERRVPPNLFMRRDSERESRAAPRVESMTRRRGPRGLAMLSVIFKTTRTKIILSYDTVITPSSKVNTGHKTSYIIVNLQCVYASGSTSIRLGCEAEEIQWSDNERDSLDRVKWKSEFERVSVIAFPISRFCLQLIGCDETNPSGAADTA